MSKHPRPTDICLHQESRVLDVSFADGQQFKLPCEYLRVYSPSAEVQGHSADQKVLQTGKRQVNIVKIVPVGNYAIGLHFDDGHDTGLYSWDTLFNLGTHQQQLWQDYLEELDAAGASRDP